MEDTSLWAEIIRAVQSPLGLAALSFLVLGTATSVLFAKERSSTVRLLAFSFLGLALISIVLAFFWDREPDSPPPVKHRVVLDLSQQQDRWDKLADWVHTVEPEVLEITDEITADLLGQQQPKVLIFPLPYHEPISDAKQSTVEDWVRNGGGLLFLGHYAGDVHHGTNPSEFLSTWGVSLEQTYLLPDSLSDCERMRGGNVRAIPNNRALVPLVPVSVLQHPIFNAVDEVRVAASPSLTLKAGFEEPDFALRAAPNTNVCAARTSGCSADGMSCSVAWILDGQRSPIVLVAFDNVGAGRVVIAGTWKLFYEGNSDNHTLMRNILEWLGEGR